MLKIKKAKADAVDSMTTVTQHMAVHWSTEGRRVTNAMLTSAHSHFVIVFTIHTHTH